MSQFPLMMMMMMVVLVMMVMIKLYMKNVIKREAAYQILFFITHCWTLPPSRFPPSFLSYFQSIN